MIVPISDADAATMDLDDYRPLQPPVGTALDGSMATAGKIFWQSEDGRITTGVWECAAGRMRADFGNDGEMVHVVKGTIHARSDTGDEQTIGPGESATFPPFWTGVWTLKGLMRKVYCTFKLDE